MGTTSTFNGGLLILRKEPGGLTVGSILDVKTLEWLHGGTEETSSDAI